MGIGTRYWPLAVAVAGCLALTVAPPRPAQAQSGARAHEQYFIEFRARPSIMGHAYIVYGHLNAAGETVEIQYAGNQPADRKYGAYIGVLMPVPGVIHSVPEDFKDRPTTVYHRRLSAIDYEHVKIAVARVRAREHHWNLLFYNCNEFAIEIAHSIGLVSSPFPWLPPDAVVTTLRLLNGG